MKNNSKKELIAKIETEAKKYFVGASGCHDWTHVERVRALALHIGKKEKADLFVVEAAALLHDIGRKEEMTNRGKICHAEKGAEISKIILKKYKFTQEQIDNVFHCIQSHRSRNGYAPTTLEAKVVFDADKIDSIGAIGAARAFLFAGNAGSNNLYTGNEKKLANDGKDYSYTKEDSSLLEYYKKLRFIYKKILTKEGKRIAKGRQKFMHDFFKRFDREIKGII
ncbi:MAG: HD domain-containing protein [Candidatus Moranbacteria bacterium]|nr:HD domain-containing protein [Candidatus Moranbacteria bacterium]